MMHLCITQCTYWTPLMAADVATIIVGPQHLMSNTLDQRAY